MKTTRMLLFGLGLVLVSPLAAAQGVPIAPGVYGCDGAAQAGPCQPSSGNASSTGSGSVIGYAHAAPKWADRWGAIADDGNGVYGIVSEKSSREEASTSALSECKRRGGGGCNLVLAYYNQCAAVVAGPAGATSVHAETEKQAIDRGMRTCSSTGGTSCRVYYSGCSLPQQVQ